MSGQNIKTHLYDRSANRCVCSHSKGNGSYITVEEFKKNIENNNIAGLCEHCLKYLKGARGRLVK